MTKEFLQETNWESEYKRDNLSKLNKRQIEILDGADLKSNEGMTFGQMYSDWKTQQGHD
tara:strand:- start:301 stop:477 length:177 start_codon:yes stop_codon:yes gene_type:complete